MGARGPKSAATQNAAALEAEHIKCPKGRDYKFRKRFKEIVESFSPGVLLPSDMGQLIQYIENEFDIEQLRKTVDSEGVMIETEFGMQVNPAYKMLDTAMKTNSTLLRAMGIAGGARQQTVQQGGTVMKEKQSADVRPMFKSA